MTSESDSIAPTLGRWFFGRGEYANPALRWLAGPTWRIATLILLGIVFAAPTHVATGWRIAAMALIAVSLLAVYVNHAVLRRRRRAAANG